MAIKEETVWIILHRTNISYFENKNYHIPRLKDKQGRMTVPKGSKIEVNVNDLPSGSKVKVTKICDICSSDNKTKIVPNQEYRVILRSREKGDGLDRCFECGKQMKIVSRLKNVAFEKSIPFIAPHLLSEWNYQLNNNTPEKVHAGSNTKYWWTCPYCKSDYDMSPDARTSGGQNCPFCAGKRVNHTNNLLVLFPAVAKEWCYELNGNMTPEQITSKSKRCVFWLCPTCLIPYSTAVYNRTIAKSGCANCHYENNKGENHPSWKSNITQEERINKRNIPEYHIWVNKIFERDNYTCQCCGQYGGNLNAHHLDGYNWCKERRFDITNGATLCSKCHVADDDSFHKIYGKGNNTEAQFWEWIENKIYQHIEDNNELSSFYLLKGGN